MSCLLCIAGYSSANSGKPLLPIRDMTMHSSSTIYRGPTLRKAALLGVALFAPSCASTESELDRSIQESAENRRQINDVLNALCRWGKLDPGNSQDELLRQKTLKHIKSTLNLESVADLDIEVNSERTNSGSAFHPKLGFDTCRSKIVGSVKLGDNKHDRCPIEMGACVGADYSYSQPGLISLAGSEFFYANEELNKVILSRIGNFFKTLKSFDLQYGDFELKCSESLRETRPDPEKVRKWNLGCKAVYSIGESVIEFKLGYRFVTGASIESGIRSNDESQFSMLGHRCDDQRHLRRLLSRVIAKAHALNFSFPYRARVQGFGKGEYSKESLRLDEKTPDVVTLNVNSKEPRDVNTPPWLRLAIVADMRDSRFFVSGKQVDPSWLSVALDSANRWLTARKPGGVKDRLIGITSLGNQRAVMITQRSEKIGDYTWIDGPEVRLLESRSNGRIGIRRLFEEAKLYWGYNSFTDGSALELFRSGLFIAYGQQNELIEDSDKIVRLSPAIDYDFEKRYPQVQ